MRMMKGINTMDTTLKERIVEKYHRMSKNNPELRLWIGPKVLSMDEVAYEVEKETEVGKKILKIETEYLEQLNKLKEES